MKVVELRAALRAGRRAERRSRGTRRGCAAGCTQRWCRRTWQRPRRITGFSEHAYTFNTYQTFNVLNKI